MKDLLLTPGDLANRCLGQLSDQRWKEKGCEKSAEGIVDTETSRHIKSEDSQNIEGLNLLTKVSLKNA